MLQQIRFDCVKPRRVYGVLMWRTTYHEPCNPVRVLANGNYADCIVKFVQAMFVINDGAMGGHVELHYDGGIAARHPSIECAPNPIAGMLDTPAPLVRNPWLDAPTGGFTPRTAPSAPTTARFTGQSRTRR